MIWPGKIACYNQTAIGSNCNFFVTSPCYQNETNQTATFTIVRKLIRLTRALSLPQISVNRFLAESEWPLFIVGQTSGNETRYYIF